RAAGPGGRHGQRLPRGRAAAEPAAGRRAPERPREERRLLHRAKDCRMPAPSPIRQDILSKKPPATQVAERFFSRIDAIDPKVRAFLSVNKPVALAQAKKVDEKIARGEKPGLLAGLPVAVKDNICTTDAPTTCASKILENYRPPYDATVVRRLREED